MLFIYLFILLQSVNPDFEFVFYNWPALKKKIWFDIPVIFAMVAFKLPFFFAHAILTETWDACQIHIYI